MKSLIFGLIGTVVTPLITMTSAQSATLFHNPSNGTETVLNVHVADSISKASLNSIDAAPAVLAPLPNTAKVLGLTVLGLALVAAAGQQQATPQKELVTIKVKNRD
ncbi:MAG: hypothetical protein F6K65_41525 [Moorea sp. SIO3C2]|nr:hypothetical protein [Moorena sp. SIO3C2]